MSLGETTDNSSFSPYQAKIALVSISAIGGVAVLVCSVALLLVGTRKLCSQLPYRLASFPVIVGLVSGAVCVLEVLSFPVGERMLSAGDVCKSVGYLMQCAQLSKLVVTTCLTLHLLALTVCNKNARRLEVIYVVLTLALPLLASVAPLILGSYGPVAGTWCWISPSNKHGFVLLYSLWYLPAAATLIFEGVSAALIVALAVWRSHAEKKNTMILVTRRRARRPVPLSTIVALLAYPVAWCVLSVPPIIEGVYGFIRGNTDSQKTPLQYGLFLATAICTPAWSLVAGAILIVHVTFEIVTGDATGGLLLSSSLRDESSETSRGPAVNSNSYQSYRTPEPT